MSRHNIGFPLSAGGGGRGGEEGRAANGASALPEISPCAGSGRKLWRRGRRGVEWRSGGGGGGCVCVCVCVEAGVRARGSLTYDSSQVNLTWSAFARFKMRSFSALMYIPNFLIRYLLLSMTI
jgi:hypothetical protein